MRLTDADGDPDVYRHVMRPGERPDAVVRELLHLREGDKTDGDFHRPLFYGRRGWR